MKDQELAETMARLRKAVREVGAQDDGHFEEANVARRRGLDLDSYWAGAIDAHHVSSAMFLQDLDDISPEPPEPEEHCPECGQVKE